MSRLQEGLRYHHLGIPTRERREDETYFPEFGVYVSGFGTSRLGVEFLEIRPQE